MQSYIKGTPNNVVVYNCEESKSLTLLMAFSGMINLKSGLLTLGGQFDAYKRGQLERNIQPRVLKQIPHYYQWGILYEAFLKNLNRSYQNVPETTKGWFSPAFRSEIFT